MEDSQPWCVPAAEPAFPLWRSPALPAGKPWMLILEVSPFQDQCLWLSTAMMLLWQGTLGYLTGACWGGGEEWPRVLLRAQSLTWCLRAALRAAGQGNGFLVYTVLLSCVRVARDAGNWKAMAAIHVHGAVLGSALLLRIWGLISGFNVSGNGSGWPLCVLAWPFGTTTLFCVLYCWVSSVCSWGGAQGKTKAEM